MMDMIKVSVIVSVYNVEKYIEKCLDSLVNQTLKDIEIILVNDGSTDGSQKIIEQYMKKYDNIRCIEKENGGAAEARNLGILKASGEYVGFMDSDDYIELEMFECLYKKAKEKNYDVVECNLHHEFPDGTIDTEECKEYTETKQLLMHGRNVVWNKIYKRDWLLKSKVTFPVGVIYEDLAFYSKLVANITSIAYVKPAFYYYVQHSDSINRSQNLKTLDIIPVLQDVKDYYKDKGLFDKYQNELEFLFTKILLLSSFNRICHIPQKRDRHMALDKNWHFLENNFPNWKRNLYVKRMRGKKGRFIRSMNPLTYWVYSKVFATIFKLRMGKV